MSQGQDKVSILDHARTTADFYDLELWLRAHLRSDAPDKPEIVQEALTEIARKMREGVLTIMIAEQLSGILGTCVTRVRHRNYKSEKKLALTGAEQFQDVMTDADTDPARVFERMQDLKERIAVLSEMSKASPKQFAVLQADYQEKDVVKHLEAALGTSVTPEYGRKLRERGKKTFDKELNRIQKDAPQ
jgi:hypothetical protein